MPDEPAAIPPKGAGSFEPDDDAAIEAAAVITPDTIAETKAWLRRVAPDVAKRLEGKA